MKKLFRLIVALLILAVALLFFKPSAKNFETWVKKDAVEKRENAKGDNIIEKLADKGVTTVTQLQILATYRYTDHKLVAYVEAHANGEKLQFIGIAGFWIKVPW